MTAIVSMALGKKSLPPQPEPQQTTANFLLPGGMVTVYVTNIKTILY